MVVLSQALYCRIRLDFREDILVPASGGTLPKGGWVLKIRRIVIVPGRKPAGCMGAEYHTISLGRETVINRLKDVLEGFRRTCTHFFTPHL